MWSLYIVITILFNFENTIFSFFKILIFVFYTLQITDKFKKNSTVKRRLSMLIKNWARPVTWIIWIMDASMIFVN